jgi:hypothetical protein
VVVVKGKLVFKCGLDDQEASGLRDALDFLKRNALFGIRDVVEDIPQQHNIEGLLSKW